MGTVHRWLGVVLVAVVCHPVMAAPPETSGPWQFGPLGCRLANYGKYQEAGWTHLPTTGLHYVFLSVPAANEVATIQERLARSGLKVAVMRGEADLTTSDGIEKLATQLESCRQLGVHYLFLSPKHPGASVEEACLRLRRGGDLAKSYGVTLVLETHPDLGTNADVHLATMHRIDHPNVRVNFDTGNISFYNHDRNAVDELKKIIDYVATVEIKDHDAKYNDWNFPALGQGKVDIPGVLRVLEEHHFRGPVTIEVEGIQGVTLTEAQIQQNIAESASYLLKRARFE